MTKVTGVADIAQVGCTWAKRLSVSSEGMVGEEINACTVNGWVTTRRAFMCSYVDGLPETSSLP
jgi:hypothetical protein